MVRFKYILVLLLFTTLCNAQREFLARTPSGAEVVQEAGLKNNAVNYVQFDGQKYYLQTDAIERFAVTDWRVNIGGITNRYARVNVMGRVYADSLQIDNSTVINGDLSIATTLANATDGNENILLSIGNVVKEINPKNIKTCIYEQVDITASSNNIVTFSGDKSPQAVYFVKGSGSGTATIPFNLVGGWAGSQFIARVNPSFTLTITFASVSYKSPALEPLANLTIQANDIKTLHFHTEQGADGLLHILDFVH